VSPIQRIPRHSAQVAARIFSGEAVVITPAENMVRMFNPVGSRIWGLTNGERTIEDIAAILTSEYSVESETATRQVNEFLEELACKGLVEFAG
jgi:hypothetical protein